MDWDDIWNGVGVTAALVAVSFLGTWAFSTKNVDYYYISNPQGSSVTCAYAHWTWHEDEKAFCSDDSNKVIDFVGKANSALKR